MAGSDFRLGDWLVQPDLGQARHGQSVVALPPAVGELLRLLAERPGAEVPEEVVLDVLRRTPPDARVPHPLCLDSAVRAIRQALGSHEAAFIEAIPGRGLRLVPADRAGSGRLGNTTVVPTPAREAASAEPALVGRTVSHYRVLSSIGQGGMGMVYRARDLRLARDVALKVLAPDLVSDPAERARLVREAQAAASLEHPRIAVVHDVDEADGVSFIVMEYVQGECLSSILARGPVHVGAALDLADEIADGLACAHARGTVHRDLKPANVMITPEGHAKIIDFGLARLVAPGDGGGASDESAALGIVGTIAYMSPEQARGQKADPRSDLFSFGVLLFELLTGRRPFDRQNAADTLSAIVRDPPPVLPPIESVPTEVHEGLERILHRCLAKSIESRYEQAGELRADLAAVRRRLDSMSLAIREIVRRQWLPSRRLAGFLAGAVCGLIALAPWLGPGLLRWARRAPVDAGRTGAPAAMAAWTPRQVTSLPGWEREPAISPDGSMIAYVASEGGHPDIWVSDVWGRQPLRLTDDAALDEEPTWLPDGSAVVFVSERRGRKDVWQVSRRGGRQTLVVADATDPSVSPDGTRIAFARLADNGFLRIVLAPLSDPERVTTLTGDKDGLWDHRDPAWSPDGRRICYAAGRGLWIVETGGGRARVITPGEADSEPSWAPDARHVYFAAERDGTVALWRIGTTDNRVERLTTGTGGEVHPSLARWGSRIAYATLREESDIVIQDLATGAHHRLESARSELMPPSPPTRHPSCFSRTGRAARFRCGDSAW